MTKLRVLLLCNSYSSIKSQRITHTPLPFSCFFFLSFFLPLLDLMNPSFSSPITPPPHRPLPQPPLPCLDHSRSPPLLQYEQPLSLTSGYYDIPSTVTKTPPEKNRNTLFAPDPPLKDYPREVTWLFFRDNKWTPFQSENHHKIEQAFTMGGMYRHARSFQLQG